MKQPLSILLVEDDINACNELQHCIEQYEDMHLVGITDDSYEALDLVRTHLPNVVLLDLELHHGSGNGLFFLDALKKSPVMHMPYILVTTHNMSIVTLEEARQLGADFTLAKYERQYSAQYVIDTIQLMRSAILRKNIAIAPLPELTPAQKEQLLTQRIQRDMDLIGINPKAIGYKYLVDSIRLTIDGANTNLARILAPKYGKSEKSIERAMQNAIKQAWVTNDIEDLMQYYTAKIRIDRGCPTLMEFVCYYASKIQSDMNK